MDRLWAGAALVPRWRLLLLVCNLAFLRKCKWQVPGARCLECGHASEVTSLWVSWLAFLSVCERLAAVRMRPLRAVRKGA